MENPKHILLVSYVFPPYYGIGGRRWAKHASELTKLGYVVHVICAKNPFDKNSLWWDLVKDNPNIRIHQVSGMYPKVLVKFEHHFIQKVLYKFWITVLPLLTKGSFLDRAIFWKGTMLKKAKEIISEYQIKHVVCTGAPFGAMHQVLELKTWFKDIFILNDLRDPWTWGPNWGFADLEPKRMQYELRREAFVMEHSDILSVPNVEMEKHLLARYPQHKDKIKIIPHFYDEKELCVLPKSASAVRRLVMYGNIYHGVEDLLDKMASLCARYKNELMLDIYTDKKQHERTFKKHDALNVRFLDQMPARELFRKFDRYDYVLLIHPEYGIHNISTKFFEIIYTRTPMILLCNEGRGPQFIKANRLGVHADLNSMDALFESIAKGSPLPDYNDAYDISEYSIKAVTEQISGYFKQ